MWTPFASLLIVEAGLAGLFLGVLASLWKGIDAYDATLWVVVWCTRVFASASGALHLEAGSLELGMYLALQVFSSFALILVLSRSEFRIRHEQLR